jgi:spermidine/putrescine-binding protein
MPMKKLFLSLCLVMAAAMPALAKEAKVLNIFIWSAYLPDEVIEKFTEKTGIKVNYDTYDSNEALLEKLQSGVADYDLVVPSDYMVKILASEKLIQAIDHAKLPNMKNLDDRFLNKGFDPGNKYSLPYFWGTTGLGYNKEKVAGPVDSWALVFDPKYKGRILMLDDMRECFAVALKYLGKSLNATDEASIKAAADLLMKQKDLVKTYNSGDFANILDAGDVDLAHGYNGQIAEVVAEDPERLGYVVPKEGGTFWMDNLCVPAGSRNLESVYAFLNFILEPEIGGEIVNGVSYASANEAARAFIDKDILEDEAIYPPDELVSHCEFLEDVGEAVTIYDRYWTEIKAQ